MRFAYEQEKLMLESKLEKAAQQIRALEASRSAHCHTVQQFPHAKQVEDAENLRQERDEARSMIEKLEAALARAEARHCQLSQEFPPRSPPP